MRVASGAPEVNAAYCSVDQTIGWDRGTLVLDGEEACLKAYR
ncbi:hypothetical protein [Nocardia sp. NPDC051981]